MLHNLIELKILWQNEKFNLLNMSNFPFATLFSECVYYRCLKLCTWTNENDKTGEQGQWYMIKLVYMDNGI